MSGLFNMFNTKSVAQTVAAALFASAVGTVDAHAETISGHVARNDVDTYRIHMNRGERRSFALEAYCDSEEQDIDLKLYRASNYGAGLHVAAGTSDYCSEQFSYVAPAGGTYVIEVENIEEPGYYRPGADYDLTIR